jgi:hypothetical protein
MAPQPIGNIMTDRDIVENFRNGPWFKPADLKQQYQAFDSDWISKCGVC